MSAEESIKRYETIESESGIKFFDPVGFLSVWKKTDLSEEYANEIKNRAEQMESILVNNEYASLNFSYIR